MQPIFFSLSSLSERCTGYAHFLVHTTVIWALITCVTNEILLRIIVNYRSILSHPMRGSAPHIIFFVRLAFSCYTFAGCRYNISSPFFRVCFNLRVYIYIYIYHFFQCNSCRTCKKLNYLRTLQSYFPALIDIWGLVCFLWSVNQGSVTLMHCQTPRCCSTLSRNLRGCANFLILINTFICSIWAYCCLKIKETSVVIRYIFYWHISRSINMFFRVSQKKQKKNSWCTQCNNWYFENFPLVFFLINLKER